MAEVEIWVIYNHPLDYPDGYVARKFIGETPTNDVKIGGFLDELRAQLPPGLTRFDRFPGDDPVIEETWL